MAWIKRNLYFLIGSVIALGLMGYGVFLLFGHMSAEQQAAQQIAAQYDVLMNIKKGPSSEENIQAAKDQQGQLRTYIAKARSFFQPIPAIPNFTTNKVSNSDFASQLRNTVTQLRRTATQQSVELPPDYYFTFAAEEKLVIFNPTTLDSMAVHLGEVKALCDILFDAKVNSLISIRRELISESDDTYAADYLGDKTISTSLADFTPYEITFKSFSAELAQVLAGLANSSNGLILKSINVEPAEAFTSETENGTMNGTQPQQMPQPIRRGGPYGGPYGGPGRYPGGGYPGGYPPPQMAQPAPAPRSSQAYINEHPFKVTLFVDVVKLKQAK